jgi:hypothetical protein
VSVIHERLQASRYDKQLAIIVPYRDRANHLEKFLPHMVKYFQRDKLDRFIKYTIHIIEQMGTGPFNRGKLLNAGFLISQDAAEYFCFHDVDYLPLWADYSYVSRPTLLIRYGLVLRENLKTFLGAVVMLSKADFLKANGYSNNYWGWGYEDADLAARVKVAGLEKDNRDGTFVALKHKHSGHNPDGTLMAGALTNKQQFLAGQATMRDTYMSDGVNSVQYELVESTKMVVGGKEADQIYHHKVII